MILSIILFSFLCQSILSNFISLNTRILNPLFVLSALILIYPYFKNNYKYYLTAFVMGICYDALFSSLPFENALLFILLSYIIRFLYQNIRENILSVHIFQIMIILLYRIFDYLLLIMIERYPFTVNALTDILFSSFLLNAIYITFLYLILSFGLEKLKKRKNFKKI